MQLSRPRALIAAGILAATAAAASAHQGHRNKGKTRPVTHEQLMKGTIKPHSEAIKKGLAEPSPTDEGWAALAMHAALLNEATYTLMDDGRSPDKVWAAAAVKQMRPATLALLKAIDARDTAAAAKAYAAAKDGCKTCHDVHKKD